MMAVKTDPTMYLYDVSPSLMHTFCKIMDSGLGSLGWRELAARILPSWLEIRCTEMHAAAGKSPTQELIWSWAQQNKTVGDLLQVLEDMGHYRALDLFKLHDSYGGLSKPPSPPTSPIEFHKNPPPDSNETSKNHHSEDKNKRYKICYSDIVAGTRNFHQDSKIGEGTFSEVYRGAKGNETFAVKVFKQVHKVSWKTMWDKFKTEMEVLHLFPHPNILELWGCCSEGGRYCLVCPYLPNGSLFRRLHHQDAGSPLSWQERLDILKGTARAVHHLHTAQPCTVICTNISSSNILLDEYLQPKLSDFGMARLRPHSVNHSCTITLDTGSRGNTGYLPDEYIRDGKLSVKLDVYSFGVVVMETLTGQKVIQESPKHTLLSSVLSAEVEARGSVDACLRFLDRRAEPWPHAEALTLLRLALDCTASKARGRPSMEDVLQTLRQLLPLPCPPEDGPHTLDDGAPLAHGPGPRPSLPVEDDEMYGPLDEPQSAAAAGAGPCERRQSEVTFPGRGEQRGGPRRSDESGATAWSLQPDREEALDLYGSWPVQCSCATEGAGQGCEDCRANGFSPSPSDAPQGDTSRPSQSIIDNPAKERLRNKIQLYDRGLIKTEELFSMASK